MHGLSQPSRNGFLPPQPESEPQNPTPWAERRPRIVFPWEPHWGCSHLSPAQNVQFPLDALSDLLPLQTPRAKDGLPSLTGLPPNNRDFFMSRSIHKSFSRKQMTCPTPATRLLGTCASRGGRLDGAQHNGTGQPCALLLLPAGPRGGDTQHELSPVLTASPGPRHAPTATTARHPPAAGNVIPKQKRKTLYICIHTYICLYIHTHIYICICLSIYTHIGLKGKLPK